MKARRETKTKRFFDLKPEYRFDYRQAKPNRFAASMKADSIVVVLDPEVAAVFPTSEDVNRFLRSVIEAMPPAKR